MESLANEVRNEHYQAMFLLETLEHIGEPTELYESKMKFLSDLFTLLTSEGRIVISVPTMVGIPVLVQRMALRLCGLQRETISKRDFIRSVFLRNADALELDWTPTAHLGLNHLKLEWYLRRDFTIAEHRNLIFSHVYVITQK